MSKDQEYQFICTADMAGKMDRVICLAGGRVKQKKVFLQETIVTVIKS
jgi:hypothetical protein